MLRSLLLFIALSVIVFAQIKVSAFSLKDGHSVDLQDHDIIFAGDHLKFEVISDRDDTLTLTSTIGNLKESLVLKKDEPLLFPTNDNYVVVDHEVGKITFIFETKDSSIQFHFATNPKLTTITTEEDGLAFLPSEDEERIYIDQMKIITNDRGAKEANVIIPRLETSTVIIQSKGYIGAGVIIEDGQCILTNYHVVSPDEKNVFIAIKPKAGDTPDRNSYVRANVLKVDMVKDLALLELPEAIKNQHRYTTLKFGDISHIKKGIDIYTMGHPHKYYFAFEYGMLNKVIDEYSWITYHVKHALQYSMNSNRGNSGGPIVNEKLELLGIVAGSDSSGKNLNFAISLTDIKEFLETQHDVRVENKSADSYKDKIVEEGHYKNARLAKIDRDNNGKYDAMLKDIDKDGVWDLIAYDTNEDGHWDRVTRY